LGAGTVTVTGNFYHFVPDIDFPGIDLDYFASAATTVLTGSRRIRFNNNPSDPAFDVFLFGEFTKAGFVERVRIPSSGSIIYCDDCNLEIGGLVAGRVTVVAGGPAGSEDEGNIYILHNLAYPGGVDTASDSGTLGVFASNVLYFRGKDNLTVHGVFYSENGVWSPRFKRVVGMDIKVDGGGEFVLYGARFQQAFVRGTLTRKEMNYDANLSLYTPPRPPSFSPPCQLHSEVSP